jgi:hypothetical protein
VDPKTKLVVFGGLGDWVPPGGNGDNKTPTPPVTAFYWLLDLHYMAEMAIGLGDAFVFFLIPRRRPGVPLFSWPRWFYLPFSRAAMGWVMRSSSF